MNELRSVAVGLLVSGFALVASATPGGELTPPVKLALVHESLAVSQSQTQMLGASRYTRTAACLPEGGVSQAEILVAAANYLKQNPQQQGLPPEALLSHALRQAYPCPR